MRSLAPVRPLLAALLLTLTASAPAWAQTSISLIAISESGLWGPDLERIEAALRKKVQGLGDLEVQSKEETVENFAESRKLGIDCQARDVECATKIGLIAGADKVLLLRAAPKEGSFYLTLLLVDVAAPDNPIRVTQWAPTSGTGFDTAIEEAAVRLFAPDRHRGDLQIQLTPPTAQVTLDGAVTPSGKGGLIENLAVGDHTVSVALRGYRGFKGSVQVRYKETSSLRVSLEPLEEGEAPAEPVTDANPPPDPADKLSDDDNGVGQAPAAGPVADDAEPSPLTSPIVLGGGAAVALGVVGIVASAAVAVIAAGAVEDLGNDLATRELAQVVGLGGIATAVVSGVVAVTGGAAIAWGLASPPPAE